MISKLTETICLSLSRVQLHHNKVPLEWTRPAICRRLGRIDWRSRSRLLWEPLLEKYRLDNALSSTDRWVNLQSNCKTGAEGCRGNRQYAVPQIGVPEDRVAQHVDVYFYVDKELLVNQPSLLGFRSIKERSILFLLGYLLNRVSGQFLVVCPRERDSWKKLDHNKLFSPLFFFGKQTSSSSIDFLTTVWFLEQGNY